MKRSHALWTLLVASTALTTQAAAGCEQKPKTPLERGAGIFARSCAGCHGPTGTGIERPGLRTKPRDLTDPALQKRLTDDQIRDTIRHGKGQMPGFGQLLGKEQLDALVLYVRTLDDAAR